MTKCEGCGGEMYSFIWPHVCMSCVKARHRSVVARGRCVCGRKRRPMPEVGNGLKRLGARRWIPCGRCLGTIRQVA
jgi:hypothetical protein